MHAQVEELGPRVVEELARKGVDRQISAVVAGDEDGHRTMLERLSDKALLDELVGDGTGHGMNIVEEKHRLPKVFRDFG